MHFIFSAGQYRSTEKGYKCFESLRSKGGGSTQTLVVRALKKRYVCLPLIAHENKLCMNMKTGV